MNVCPFSGLVTLYRRADGRCGLCGQPAYVNRHGMIEEHYDTPDHDAVDTASAVAGWLRARRWAR